MNIGTGSAATALAKIVKDKISVEVPRVNLSTLDKVPGIFGGAEKLVTTVYLKVLGDLSGVILFSFDKADAHRFADIVLGQEQGKTKVLDEMARSAIKEVAMILSRTYVSALAKLLNMRLLLSFPAPEAHICGALLSTLMGLARRRAGQPSTLTTPAGQRSQCRTPGG